MAFTKRWVLINKKTGNTRTSFRTRDSARSNKRVNERIWDSIGLNFVR